MYLLKDEGNRENAPGQPFTTDFYMFHTCFCHDKETFLYGNIYMNIYLAGNFSLWKYLYEHLSCLKGSLSQKGYPNQVLMQVWSFIQNELF